VAPSTVPQVGQPVVAEGSHRLTHAALVQDVQRVLAAIGETSGAGSASNPNRLEALGNKALRSPAQRAWTAQAPRCACSAQPVLAVITVNRVQVRRWSCSLAFLPIVHPL
jgi:hypothetical protein